MFRTLLILAAIIATGFCGVYEKSWKFDVDQIHKLVDRNIACLENSGDLSTNATMMLALAQGFLVEAYSTVPNLHGRQLKMVQGFLQRMSTMIENSIMLYPDENLFRALWRSQYFDLVGHFPFSLGQVQVNGPIKMSIEDIVSNYLNTEKYRTCLQNLLQTNKLSETGRKCVFPCKDEIYNNDYDSGISAESKAMYNGFQTVLNCTNMPIERTIVWEATFCSRILSELEVMLPHLTLKLVDDTLYYYLEKLLVCNAWGFEEFQSPKYIQSLISMMDCNGCVGMNKGIEVAQVLTAQTLATMGLTFRNALQKDANNN